jgi:endonuclease YncB( thermonuclease family)
MRPNQSWDRRRLVSWVTGIVLSVAVVTLERACGLSPHNRRDTGQQTLPAGGVVEGTANLTDGDSFHIKGIEIRMLGIDAPEGRQTCERNGRTWPCGEEARRHLQSLIGNNTVRCEGNELDQHGRMLGTCTAGGRDLNREMVASGFAVAFGRQYTREEDAARRSGAGLWSGTFQRPQDWRRDHGVGSHN